MSYSPYWPNCMGGSGGAGGSQLALSTNVLSLIPGNSVVLPGLGPDGVYSTLKAQSVTTSVLNIDNQNLTANGTELLLNGIPLATTSNLSSIADWSLDPAISTVNIANNNVININNLNANNVVGSNGFFNNIITQNFISLSSFVSTTSYTSTISSVVEVADVAIISSLFANNGTFSTLFGNSGTFSTLNVSSLSGIDSVANWANYAAVNDVVVRNGKKITTNYVANAGSNNDLTLEASRYINTKSAGFCNVVDMGADIGTEAAYSIVCSNGNRGQINLAAYPGVGGIQGEIHLDAYGGVVGDTGVAFGGLIDLTAWSKPSISLCNATSAIRLNASKINLYAGVGVPLVPTLPGYATLTGDMGIQISSGLPTIFPNLQPFSIYQYGTGGIVLESGALADVRIRNSVLATNSIKPDDQTYDNLVIRGRVNLAGSNQFVNLQMVDTLEMSNTCMISNVKNLHMSNGAIDGVQTINGISYPPPSQNLTAGSNINITSNAINLNNDISLSSISVVSTFSQTVSSINMSASNLTVSSINGLLPGDFTIPPNLAVSTLMVAGNVAGSNALFQNSLQPGDGLYVKTIDDGIMGLGYVSSGVIVSELDIGKMVPSSGPSRQEFRFQNAVEILPGLNGRYDFSDSKLNITNAGLQASQLLGISSINGLPVSVYQNQEPIVAGSNLTFTNVSTLNVANDITLNSITTSSIGSQNGYINIGDSSAFLKTQNGTVDIRTSTTLTIGDYNLNTNILMNNYSFSANSSNIYLNTSNGGAVYVNGVPLTTGGATSTVSTFQELFTSTISGTPDLNVVANNVRGLVSSFSIGAGSINNAIGVYSNLTRITNSVETSINGSNSVEITTQQLSLGNISSILMDNSPLHVSSITLSSINGQPISFYEPGGVSTISTFQELFTSTIGGTPDLNVVTNTFYGEVSSFAIVAGSIYNGVRVGSNFSRLANSGETSIAGSNSVEITSAQLLSMTNIPKIDMSYASSIIMDNSPLFVSSIFVSSINGAQPGGSSVVAGSNIFIAGNAVNLYDNVVNNSITVSSIYGAGGYLTVGNNLANLYLEEANAYAELSASTIVRVRVKNAASALSVDAFGSALLRGNSQVILRGSNIYSDAPNLWASNLNVSSINNLPVGGGGGQAVSTFTDITLTPSTILKSATGFSELQVYNPVNQSTAQVGATGFRVISNNGDTNSGIYTRDVNNRAVYVGNNFSTNRLAYTVDSTVSFSNISTNSVRFVSGTSATGQTFSTIMFSSTFSQNIAPNTLFIDSNSDFSVWNNNIFAGQLKLGANQVAGAASFNRRAELTFFAPNKTGYDFSVQNGDYALRYGTSQSTLTTATEGYLLDTTINRIVCSTISNNPTTNLALFAAFFPSTTNGTIGPSTITTFPAPLPLTQFGVANFSNAPSTFTLTRGYKDTNYVVQLTPQADTSGQVPHATVLTSNTFTAHAGSGSTGVPFFWTTIGNNY